MLKNKGGKNIFMLPLPNDSDDNNKGLNYSKTMRVMRTSLKTPKVIS